MTGRRIATWVFGVIIITAVVLSMAFIAIIEVAAREGYPSAQNELGRWYDYGIWLHSTNKQEAAKWYSKAAENNYAKGQYNLGLLLKRQGDYQGAARWYLRAAQQDFAPAQNNLGVLYSEGLGVTKDRRTAVFWYKKAAENGHEIAQFTLGLAYISGKGVGIDYKKGADWIRQSAKQDFAPAQELLALLHIKGQGVKEDYTEALLWAKKAYANGNSKSANTIKLIEQLQQE